MFRNLFLITEVTTAINPDDLEDTMHKVVLGLTAATSLVATWTALPSTASAAPFAQPSGIQGAADSLDVADTVQFFWEGHRYCWYDDGWQGSGWYWCGYRWHRGVGWGGGVGWHGWHHRGGFEHREGREIERGRHFEHRE